MADMNNCTDYLFLSYVAWARQHLLVQYCSLIPHLEKEEICLNRNLNFKEKLVINNSRYGQSKLIIILGNVPFILYISICYRQKILFLSC